MKRYLTVRCSDPNCMETSFFEYSSRKAYNESYKRHKGTWKCSRHDEPEKVLSVNNPTTRTEIVAAKSERYPNLEELFWHGGGLISGYTCGVGWKAFADDFPPGTKIIVEATLVLPQEVE